MPFHSLALFTISKSNLKMCLYCLKMLNRYQAIFFFIKVRLSKYYSCLSSKTYNVNQRIVNKYKRTSVYIIRMS